jgi:hypothetical protein
MPRVSNIPAKKAIVLSAMPIAIVSIYIFLFGLNVPFLDQWEVVRLLEKLHQGVLSLSDLTSQHNEHRPLFPRLIWISLAGFTHYNINAQLWVNLLIAVGTFLFFVHRSVKTWKQLGISTSPLLIPLMSLLVFNLGQRESWLQGIQTIMFLGIACAIIGLFLLAEDSSRVTFWCAIALGVIANYSMANGLLYWPVGFIVLSLTAPKNSRILKSFLWITCGSVCTVLFLTNWQSSGNLNVAYVIAHPLEWSIWTLNFLGSPLMTLWHVAWIFGLASVGLYALIVGHLIRAKQWKPLIPYFATASFILLTAFSISLGRMEMGMPQAVVPRYLTMSVWYWMSLLTVFPVLGMNVLYRRVLYSSLAVSLVLLTILGGWRGYVSIYQRILPAYQTIKSGQSISDAVLARISSDPAAMHPALEFLRENKLSVYAE